MAEATLLLDDAERKRFSEYLEREADSAREIAERMAEVAGPAGEMLARQERAYAAAAALIAKRLRATEGFTVSSEELSNG